jgi:hypothetical protein
MEVWQSWAVVLAAAGALYYWYSNYGNRQRVRKGRQVADSISKPNRRDLNSKADIANLTDFASDKSENERKKTRKASQKTKSQPNQPTALRPIQVAGEEEEAEDVDLDWAKRLAGNQTGTSLARPAQSKSTVRTAKQSSLKNDLPENSSLLSNGSEDKLPSGRDVSDMLEPAAPGPSILRLTEPANPVRPKQQLQKKSDASPKETKKQRQNRKKNEEARLQREQDEQERRILMEKQRRTAREARGEPAKNGVQSAQAPSSNAWSGTQERDQTPKASQAAASNDSQLLDTFEHDSTTSSSNPPTSEHSTTTTGTNWNDLPPEEEQLRMAMEDSAWSTVSHTKRGKKKQANGVEENGINGDVSEPSTSETIKTAAPTPAIKSSNSFGKPSKFENLAVNDPSDDWGVL